MDASSLIKSLIGDITGFDISLYDYYVRDKFGVFIPIFDPADDINITHKHVLFW